MTSVTSSLDAAFARPVTPSLMAGNSAELALRRASGAVAEELRAVLEREKEENQQRLKEQREYTGKVTEDTLWSRIQM